MEGEGPGSGEYYFITSGGAGVVRAEPGRASVPLITHVTHRRRGEGRLCTDGEMRGWIPTVESNGAAHRVVWLGESANLYGEMISTSSSAPSGLKWLI